MLLRNVIKNKFGPILFGSLTVFFSSEAQQKEKMPAVSPALERYTCYQSFASVRPGQPWLHRYQYMGFFQLLGDGKYQYGYNKKVTGSGTFTISTTQIYFQTGPLKNVGGKYELKKTGRHYIELAFEGKNGNKVRQYCNCDDHVANQKKPPN